MFFHILNSVFQVTEGPYKGRQGICTSAIEQGTLLKSIGLYLPDGEHLFFPNQVEILPTTSLIIKQTLEQGATLGEIKKKLSTWKGWSG